MIFSCQKGNELSQFLRESIERVLLEPHFLEILSLLLPRVNREQDEKHRIFQFEGDVQLNVLKIQNYAKADSITNNFNKEIFCFFYLKMGRENP